MRFCRSPCRVGIAGSQGFDDRAVLSNDHINAFGVGKGSRPQKQKGIVQSTRRIIKEAVPASQVETTMKLLVDGGCPGRIAAFPSDLTVQRLKRVEFRRTSVLRRHLRRGSLQNQPHLVKLNHLRVRQLPDDGTRARSVLDDPFRLQSTQSLPNGCSRQVQPGGNLFFAKPGTRKKVATSDRVDNRIIGGCAARFLRHARHLLSLPPARTVVECESHFCIQLDTKCRDSIFSLKQEGFRPNDMTLPRKHLFDLPKDVIYLDGNSLGPLPLAVPARLEHVARDQWGAHLITGWNVDGWMASPVTVADRLGRLIGATPGTTVLGDTLSIKVYQALSAALALRPHRRVILSDTGNFPSDLYMAEGLIRLLGQGYELRTVPPEDVKNAVTDEVAAVLLTQVDYRTGRMHDMAQLTKRAHAAGAVMIWDLAHSAGAIPVDIAESKAEFAVGCTYKYLNGGPGAPAFITVRWDIVEQIEPALSGWLGHDAPFAFELSYRPGAGIERMRVGTPPILQIAALDAALDVWEGLDMMDVLATSTTLSERFIQEIEARCPALTLISPREPENRGSQVAFRFEHGYAAMQALIANGVVGDFRAPDVMRFGITPLYLDETDILNAVDVLEEVLNKRLWDDPGFLNRQRVT